MKAKSSGRTGGKAGEGRGHREGKDRPARAAKDPGADPAGPDRTAVLEADAPAALPVIGGADPGCAATNRANGANHRRRCRKSTSASCRKRRVLNRSPAKSR